MIIITHITSVFRVFVGSPHVSSYFRVRDSTTTVYTWLSFPPTTIATTLRTVITSIERRLGDDVLYIPSDVSIETLSSLVTKMKRNEK